jgi:hypothetical protein
MQQSHRCDFLDGAPLALLGSRAPRELLPIPDAFRAHNDMFDVPTAASQMAPQFVIARGLPLTPLCSEQSYLLHHLASRLIQRETTERYTSNIAFMPRFLVIAESFDFVRDAALAVSAQDLAQGRKDYGAVVQKYQFKAVHGIRKSLVVFSKEIADAVLAASILLSLQAVDEASFASFTCGTASIIESIQDRRNDVFLSDIASNSFSLASNISVNQGIAVPRPNAARNEDKMYAVMSGPLHELSKRLSDVRPAKASAVSLLEICRRLQNPLARTNIGYRFSILNPAMRQLFWLPSLMIRSTAETWILVLMAYWYAMIMSLEPIRYAPVSQLMRSSCIAPVTAISGRLNELPERDEKELACQLMELPVMIANDMQDQIKQHEREVRSAGLRRGIGIKDG